MRLYKREVKDPQMLNKILETCDVVRIGCQDEEGLFVVPVNYGYEYDFKQGLKLYLHSAAEGRKAAAFDREPTVAFEMDYETGLIRGDYSCSYSMGFCSIMGNGRIRKLQEREEKIKGLTLLMNHIAPEAEIHFRDEMLARVNIYCIEADSFTGKMREPK